MSKPSIPGITLKTDLQDNRCQPSKCCALKCEELCLTKDSVELPFCERHSKDEDLWLAWHEVT